MHRKIIRDNNEQQIIKKKQDRVYGVCEQNVYNKQLEGLSGAAARTGKLKEKERKDKLKQMQLQP